MTQHIHTRLVLASSAAAAAVALLASCSSSAGGGSGAGGQPAGGAGKSTSAAGERITVALRAGRLVAPNGHTLYENTADSASKIICMGFCATQWPPLAGPATAGHGVTTGKLGTASRPDGTVQVTYAGHPLYEFANDKAPGDTGGNGFKDLGGTWHVATAATAAASAPASSSSAGGGGYGGGGGSYY